MVSGDRRSGPGGCYREQNGPTTTCWGAGPRKKGRRQVELVDQHAAARRSPPEAPAGGSRPIPQPIATWTDGPSRSVPGRSHSITWKRPPLVSRRLDRYMWGRPRVDRRCSRSAGHKMWRCRDRAEKSRAGFDLSGDLRKTEPCLPAKRRSQGDGRVPCVRTGNGARTGTDHRGEKKAAEDRPGAPFTPLGNLPLTPRLRIVRGRKQGQSRLAADGVP